DDRAGTSVEGLTCRVGGRRFEVLEAPTRAPNHRIRIPVPRKKLNGELPPEVLAVLQISPDLKPCPKFRRAYIYQFAEHLNEGKCEQCLTLSRQWSKELGMMKLLRDSRN